MPGSELKALFQLLDDSDKEVFDHVFEKLKSYGLGIIPHLESYWENSLDPELQYRIELLIHKIQFENLREELTEWAENDSNNLLAGAILIARYQFPDFDDTAFYRELQEIEQSIWLELSEYLTSFEQINVFNKVFYDIYGFGGSPAQIKDPNAYFVNKVLETKKGTPLSLGTLYLVLAERLQIPVYGVNLPRYFILSYCNDDDTPFLPVTDKPGNVLFYINPLNKGHLISLKEIDEVKKNNPEVKDHHLQPCTNTEIIRQFLVELEFVFQSNSNHEKMQEMKILIETLDRGRGD